MSILTLNEVTKYYGADKVLDAVSFSMDKRDRLGLVGRNGGGKSTLLHIIAGGLEPDQGTVFKASGARVRMLTQDPVYEPESSVWDEMRSVLVAINRLEEQLRGAEYEMEETTRAGGDVSALLARYARLEDEYSRMGGYDWQVQISSILTGLGFSLQDFDQKMKTLSSGQRVRVALGKALLEEPDILLLDEPTNHLDVDAAEWLEDKLKQFAGAVLAVSHDRFFLNAACNRILELENNTITSYTGNYDQYVGQREFKREQEEREYERHTKKVEDLKDYIRRYQAGERATLAKSREKWLRRLGAVPPPKAGKHLSIVFRPATELGKTVFRVEGVGKDYGPRTVLNGVDFTVLAPDRLGIIGKNGAGKTTLLKILIDADKPSRGSVWVGPSVVIGYFWQDLDALNPENTVIEELMEGTDLLPGEARSILGRFLFSGDDVYKKVSVLSGGEKNRLTLAKLVISGCNVLVLDEPTNHLDLDAKDALAKALCDFPGAVLFVTHDRQFLQDVATKILEVVDMRAGIYAGNYLMYREEKARRLERARLLLEKQASTQEPKQIEATPAKREGGGDPIRRRLQQKAHEERVLQVQREIEALERERAELEARLADPEIYRLGQAVPALERYKDTEGLLKLKYEEWEALEANAPR